MVEEQIGQDSARLKVLRKRLWVWGSVAAVAQAIAFYALFGQVVPAAREYRQIRERLCLEVTRANGTREDYGCRDLKRPEIQKTGWLFGARPAHALIVNAGEAFLVDAWQNIVELEIMKFHAIGTGSTAVAEADTALVTELTTQYSPTDGTRATGSTTEASASVFRTVGTNTVDATVTIAEWGLFTQATVGGTMFSRALVSPTIGLNSGDSLQTTWDLTVE